MPGIIVTDHWGNCWEFQSQGFNVANFHDEVLFLSAGNVMAYQLCLMLGWVGGGAADKSLLRLLLLLLLVVVVVGGGWWVVIQQHTTTTANFGPNEMVGQFSKSAVSSGCLPSAKQTEFPGLFSLPRERACRLMDFPVPCWFAPDCPMDFSGSESNMALAA